MSACPCSPSTSASCSCSSTSRPPHNRTAGPIGSAVLAFRGSLRPLGSRLLDHPDDQGDEVDDHAVRRTDEADLQAAGNDLLSDVSGLLVSLDYTLSEALLVSLIFGPCAVALEYLMPKARKPMDKVYLALAVLVAATVLIVLLHALRWETLSRKGQFPGMVTIPPMLINPVFLALILTAIAIGDFYWARWLRGRFRHEDRTITFFSDRRSVTLRVADIDFVESNDTEVRLVTADGNAYRNKTGISQWGNLLGEDFLRIHRSYLVNIARSRLVSPEEVIIGQHSLPVSRKYRESVSGTLRPDADAE